LKNGVTESEVRQAKSYLNGKYKMKQESADVRAFYNGENEIYQMQSKITYDKKFKTFIEPVTKARIDDAIKTYFVPNGMVVSIVSNKSLQSEKIIKMTEDTHTFTLH
jgi:predicted Zn-dependent peptidase